MREKPNTNSPARGEQTESSRERRLLLKAAAATAPLIATLPNGAAFANASAANCVAEDQERSRAAPGVEVLEPPHSDDYLRMAAWRRTCNGENFYFIDANAQWYKEDGTVLLHIQDGDLCGDRIGGQAEADTRVYVLAHWRPENGLQAVSQVGFFPVTKLEEDQDLTALTASCMASMDTGFDANDATNSWSSRA